MQILTWNISTHTLTWSVTCIIDKTIRLVKFQLTRSRGAWHWESWKCRWHGHFNSHAHVERDDKSYLYFLTVIISTHTLTWSVTYPVDSLTALYTFQLTRSRGAWLKLAPFMTVKINFNSHAHVERDLGYYFGTEYKLNFNSHAHVERD